MVTVKKVEISYTLQRRQFQIIIKLSGKKQMVLISGNKGLKWIYKQGTTKNTSHYHTTTLCCGNRVRTKSPPHTQTRRCRSVGSQRSQTENKEPDKELKLPSELTADVYQLPPEQHTHARARTHTCNRIASEALTRQRNEIRRRSL